MAIFSHERKVYDLATAAFFAFGLGLMARRAWLPFLIIFALGCINRETMILLVPVFAIHFFRQIPLSMWLIVLTAQLVIFVFVRTWLMIIFADNPGVPFWWRLEANLQLLAESHELAMLHGFGIGLFAWIVALKWGRLSAFVRDASLVLVPALIALYLLFGWIGEIRVFIEAFPIVWGIGSGQLTLEAAI